MDWTSQVTLVRKLVAERYVFPEVAAAVASRLAEGDYSGCADDESFGVAVTADLQSVNGDKHLRLRHCVSELPDREEMFDLDEYRVEAALDGYGIAAVRRLDGNVGLLDIRRLYQSDVAGPAIVAAMNLLASTDALLLDLRQNRGGDPSTVALLCSYLFDEPTHLNNIYSRADDSTSQYWTAPYVPGAMFGATKPIYVLTSSETFSGAEELANNLRELKRATLIGEPTRGGAHPGGWHRVTAHLEMMVPTGRAINPVSGTNWEGVGVQPHVSVPAASAFDTAYQLALQDVVKLGAEGPRREIAEQAQKALDAL